MSLYCTLAVSRDKRMRGLARRRSRAGGRRGGDPRSDRRGYQIEPLENRLLLAASLVKDIWPGATGAFDLVGASPVAVNGVTVFLADDGTNPQVWRSDGTSAGTVKVSNFDDGGQAPLELTKVGNRAFFRAFDAAQGWHLYGTDGYSVWVVGPDGTGISDCNGVVYYDVNDGTHGEEPWAADGGPNSAHMIADISPGLFNSNPRDFTYSDGLVYFDFNAGAAGRELWRTDGTAAGTLRVAGISPNEMLDINGVLLIAADGFQANGCQLWRYDTTNGLVMLVDSNPGSGAHSPEELTNMNSVLYYVGFDPAHGTEVWRSDGTAAGTWRLTDINPGAASADPGWLANVNGTLFFPSFEPTHGYELYKSNGTVAGTALVRDINPGADSSTPAGHTVVNNTLYFVANEPTYGWELWQTDGTSGGTIIAGDVWTGSNSSTPRNLVSYNGMVLFTAEGPQIGRELWKTGEATAPQITINAVEGQSWSGPVGTFTDPSPTRPASDFSATILWGDGGTSPGTITQPGGAGTPFLVSGSHLWTDEGGYPVVIMVRDLVTNTLNLGNINVSSRAGYEGEPTVAMDPTNPDRLFVASNKGDLGADGLPLAPRGLFAAYSRDGGKTWNRRTMGDGTDGLPVALCDPQAKFDRFGNLFLIYIDTPRPNGVRLAMSTDGGQTFSIVYSAASFPGEDGLDQPSLAVGPGRGGIGDTVWVSFKEMNYRVRVAGAPVTGLGQVGTFGEEEAPGSLVGNFGDIAVGPQGQVLVVYQTTSVGEVFSDVLTNLDPDGLGPEPMAGQTLVFRTNVSGVLPIPAAANRPIDAETNFAWDTTNGSHRGRLYLTYTSAPDAGYYDTNIFLRYSDDNGSTWSNPVRVDDDSSGKSQFLPSIALDPVTGQVAVSWYDARSDPNNLKTLFLTAVSSDGGQSFTPSVLVSQGASDATVPGLSYWSRVSQYGDYTFTAFYNGVLYPIWTDNSNAVNNPDLPQFDIVTSRVTVAQVADAALSATGVDMTTARYRVSRAVVARFTDANPYGTLADFSAQVDWGDGRSSPATVRVGDGVFEVVAGHAYAQIGTFSLKIHILDHGGATADATAQSTVIEPPPSPIVVTGTEVGAPPHVRVFDALTGQEMFSFFAYDRGFLGGVRVASADFNFDGYCDIVTATGPGASHVRIFDGYTGQPMELLVSSFLAFPGPGDPADPNSTYYSLSFKGGVSVAIGDVNGDWYPDIIVGADAGAGPHVKAFNGYDGSLLRSFYAYDPAYQGGVHVAAGDVTGDYADDIITGAGADASHVRVWNGADNALIANFLAYGPGFHGGVNVTAGDVNGDGRAEVITGTAVGPPHVKAFDIIDFANPPLVASFFAYDAGFGGGVRVGAMDHDWDGLDEIVTGAGPSGQPHVKVFRALDALEGLSFMAYAPGYLGGIYVGGGS